MSKKRKCNMNCFSCVYKDCIAPNAPLTLKEYQQSSFIEKTLIKDNPTPLIDMTPYIRNRPDKEVYEKCRNKKYEDKRKNKPERLESKRSHYAEHKKDPNGKLAYQKDYYEKNRDEVNNKAKARYEANKEKINKRRKELRDAKKEANANKKELSTAI